MPAQHISINSKAHSFRFGIHGYHLFPAVLSVCNAKPNCRAVTIHGQLISLDIIPVCQTVYRITWMQNICSRICIRILAPSAARVASVQSKIILGIISIILTVFTERIGCQEHIRSVLNFHRSDAEIVACSTIIVRYQHMVRNCINCSVPGSSGLCKYLIQTVCLHSILFAVRIRIHKQHFAGNIL